MNDEAEADTHTRSLWWVVDGWCARRGGEREREEKIGFGRRIDRSRKPGTKDR